MITSDRFRYGRWPALIALVVAIAAVVPGVAAGARRVKPTPKGVGHLWTEDNNTTHNHVLQFTRLGNGHLVPSGTFGTGGRGGVKPEHGCTAACPVLDAQNEVITSVSKHFLFVVNAGSSTISSFLITPTGLKLVDQKPSHGTFPTSLTNHGSVLYVLNSSSLNIAGFRVSATGKLTYIKGSSQHLTAGAVANDVPPKEIQFDNTGRWLAVTLLNVPVIDTFHVTGTGIAGPAHANKTANPLPFAFSVDPHDRLLVAEIVNANIPPATPAFPPVSKGSSYALNTVTGKLVHVDSEADHGFAACWTTLTNNGLYFYVVNTGGGAPTGPTVSAFKVNNITGKLTLIQVTPHGKGVSPLPSGDELARFDVTLSPDNHYLYVDVPGVVQPKSKIDIYKVLPNGHLVSIGASPYVLAPGTSGLATK